MSFQDHLRTCSYCRFKYSSSLEPQPQKPTVRIKAASSYRRERKSSELASLITGTSYPRVSFVGEKKTKTKGAYSMALKVAKLRELAKIKG